MAHILESLCDEYDTAYLFKARSEEFNIGGDSPCVILKENGRAITQLEYFDNYEQRHIKVDLADVGARLRYRYSIKAMRPIESLNDNEIPVLFLHGENDTFILPKNSSDMAERTKGYKEYHVIPKTAHAVSVLTDPVLYEEHIRQFLKNIGMQVETCD